MEKTEKPKTPAEIAWDEYCKILEARDASLDALNKYWNQQEKLAEAKVALAQAEERGEVNNFPTAKAEAENSAFIELTRRRISALLTSGSSSAFQEEKAAYYQSKI